MDGFPERGRQASGVHRGLQHDERAHQKPFLQRNRLKSTYRPRFEEEFAQYEKDLEGLQERNQAKAWTFRLQGKHEPAKGPRRLPLVCESTQCPLMIDRWKENNSHLILCLTGMYECPR